MKGGKLIKLGPRLKWGVSTRGYRPREGATRQLNKVENVKGMSFEVEKRGQGGYCAGAEEKRKR